MGTFLKETLYLLIILNKDEIACPLGERPLLP